MDNVVLATNVIMVGLGLLTFYFNRFKSCWLTRAFLFFTPALSFLYNFYYFNFPFYAFVVTSAAVFYTLMVWELSGRLLGRSLDYLLYFVPVIIASHFFYNYSIYEYHPQMIIAGLAIALSLPLVIEKKNYFFSVLVIASTYSLVIDVLKLFLPIQEKLKFLVDIESKTSFITFSILLVPLLYKFIITTFAEAIIEARDRKQQLEGAFSLSPDEANADFNNPAASVLKLATVEAISDHRSYQSNQYEYESDYDLTNATMEDAAFLMSLRNRPFLSHTDLQVYLDMEPEDVDRFIDIHDIKKVYLIDDDERWVVRREDIDTIS